MRPVYVSSALYSLTLGAVGLAYMGGSSSGQSLGFDARPATQILAMSDGASCPLPVGQQVKAVKAFREMLPVFRHPRCFNCHGNFDITAEKHEGSDVAQKSGLNPRALLTIKERVTLHQGCDVCHGNIRGSLTRLDGTKLSGWLVAPKPMLWDGKDDEELCIQMKQFEPSGAQFVDHLKTDHNEIEFIDAAFHGDRALGDKLDEFDLKLDPPLGTQADLVSRAQRWVDLVGNGYTASDKCGCVMPKIKLQVDHTILVESPNGLPSREESHVKFEVNLEPTDDPRIPMYAGEHSLNREIRMTLPKGCSGKAARHERWLLYALVDSVDGSIKVRHTAFDDEPTGEIVCRRGGGTARMGIFPGHVSLVNWEAVIPADSGSSKTLDAKAAGQKEALTLTVLEAPPGH